MGPNGSGKSTLAHVLSGRDGYEVNSGSATYKGLNLLDMLPEIRAREGMFLAFQYPIEIPGVNNTSFLKKRLMRSANIKVKRNWMPSIFSTLLKTDETGWNERRSLKRPVNQGFSGGEKKRNEILQMAVLHPQLAILDETDSGLDIDALRIVAGGVNKLRSDENAFVVITHYQRLLDYIVPDFVHVLSDGQIIKSGTKDLALELEERGYDWLLDQPETVAWAE